MAQPPVILPYIPVNPPLQTIERQEEKTREPHILGRYDYLRLLLKGTRLCPMKRHLF